MDLRSILTLLFLTSTFITALSTSSLDPKQLTALQSMGLPTTLDPCNSKNQTLCDSSAPFKHLVSLTLTNCSSDMDMSSTALHSLSTLHSLSLLNCPVNIFRHPLPSSLSSSLLSFSCVSHSKHVTGVWLSHLKNLTHLTLVDVPVTASGPFVFLSQMPYLSSVVVSGCNLSGQIPHHWHSLNLTRLDLSGNKLRGALPRSINVLASLEFLNLSANALTGVLPESIGEVVSLKNASFSRNSLSGSVPGSLKELSELVHLDLSANQFNGSVPGFLGDFKNLKYLNLQDNSFQGVLPFNATFVKKLDVLKVGGNSNLCYNHSVLSSKLKLGIAPCDKYGMPVSPPPDKSDKSSDGSGDDGNGDDGNDDSEDDNEGGDGSGKKSHDHHNGPNRLVLGVAIGLSCLVFLVIFCICISKCCR